ncbi:MAG: diadenylate cyclase [bacterium]|nr:diadenylate cyclase [bacterium]
MKQILDILSGVGFSGFVDIVLMTVIVYAVLVWFQRKRAAFVLTGILICGVIYLIAHQFHLFLISSLFQGFFAVILILVIVIFQEELKYLFEQIAVYSFNRKLKGKPRTLGREVEILIRTLTDLARERIGALIVLKGKDLIIRHLSGGTDLYGQMGEAILKSLFDPHSPGHDGAVIIHGSQITQFGCHLPLSNDFKKLTREGTRHAAALGLSELSDALCLVVSEERGTLSVVRYGEISEVHDPEKLGQILQKFYEELSPVPRKKDWKNLLSQNFREKGLAVVITVSLWFVLVYESKLVHKTFIIQVEYPELTSDLVVSEIDPNEVQATFSATRNAFHFINQQDIRLSLKLLKAKEGTRTFTISESNFTFPENVVLESVSPRYVQVRIDKKEEEPVKK